MRPAVPKAVDKMRCFRKRSMLPVLAFLISFLLFFNLYTDDEYVLVSHAEVCSTRVELPDQRCQRVPPGGALSVGGSITLLLCLTF